MRTFVIALVFVAFGVGCAHPVERVDWSTYDGPEAALFRREELPPPSFPDPLEALNRSVSAINHGLIVVAVDPLGRVYRFVTPLWLRDRVRDFSTNLLFPRRLAANLLQGKMQAAGSEIARFAVNTTAGGLGFFDLARRWGFEASDEDFGQVFATWGWRPSTYLVLPFSGPSSVRDALGLVPDSLLDPASWFFPAGPILTFNEQVDSLDEYRRFVATTFDPYEDVRVLWSLDRDERIEGDGAQAEDTAATQTLQAAFLAPRNPDFVERLRTRHVTVPATGRRLPYSVRLQPGRAPMVFIVPGLGSHRLGGGALALAEMAWNRGFSVAIISSTFCFEFMERASSSAVPGHAPNDARDVHEVLDAVDRDLAHAAPERISARVLLGYSLGAFHALFIAAREREAAERGLVRFDRYLTLDAPVALFGGMSKLDGFYNAPLAFPPERREQEVKHILRKALEVGKKALRSRERREYARMDAIDRGHADLTPPIAVPFSNVEAEYLIGLAFRRTLREVLWSSQSRHDLGVLRTQRRWWSRGPAYAEMADYSFVEYLHAFVLPWVRDQRGDVRSVEDIIHSNDLRSLESRLRAHPRIRHFANRNDFLTTDEDAAWLTRVLGADHVRFFPSGGHLGNLDRPEVQAEAMETIADLLPRERHGDAPSPDHTDTESPQERQRARRPRCESPGVGGGLVPKCAQSAPSVATRSRRAAFAMAGATAASPGEAIASARP